MGTNPGVPYEEVLAEWCRDRFRITKAATVEHIQTEAQQLGLKIPDFALFDTAGTEIALLDAKGRADFCENYLEQQQLTDFVEWTRHNYRVGLVWVYSDHHTASAPPFERIEYCGYRYVLGCADVLDYSKYSKLRSKRWKTKFVGRKEFREIIQPLTKFVY